MVFAKPENALKRAEEFIDVGKKQRALDTLYEVIRSKKHRAWQKIHEQIMRSYLNLCVELKESHMAKDGLHQYKTICQNVNVKSLEDVINGFLQLAEEKAEKAKKESSDANTIVDVDDLEQINSPESVLLKAVSGESSQDRADRDLLAPWLKFVWESYKQCLDLLKNNNKVEQLYQQVAKLAFAFCVKYQRKTEFRKLCETIRQHMVQSQKYTNQATSIDLNKPETQNNHLETRLIQLNYAISMELWQEAYKAVEDIYGLMNLSKTKPKPGQMFNYYTKLSLIFWKAGNHLFHAATLQKLFVLLKEQKKTITPEELTKISTRLLLATLAIPIPPNRTSIDECLDQDEVTQEKLKRLSSLLNLQQAPTRLSLLKDLTKYNVVAHVFPEVKDLYKWLEIEFHPLHLSSRVTQCLDSIEAKPDPNNENYSQYIPALKEIAVTRLVKQVSQIYTTIEIARFVRLAPKNIPVFDLEKIIVDAAKQLDLQVRINHQTKSLHFGNDLYVAQKEDLPEGPSIQSMPSEQIRNQLITMSESLQQAQELIYSQENRVKREELANTIAHIYRQTCEKHHADLLRRKLMIEELKEMYERLVYDREQAELQEKRNKEEEKIRIQTDINRKNKDLNAMPSKRDQLIAELESVAEREDDEVKRQIELANKEKKELMKKLKKEEEKFDHFVRACHENEIPLVEKALAKDAVVRKEFWEKKEIERIENLEKEQLVQSENRERLLRMVADKELFEESIHKVRREEFEKKMVEFEARLVQAREAKMLERKEKRKTDRRNSYFKEIEDRKKREEDERRMKDDEERRRKQDEQAEKQRVREREIEEKLARRQQQEGQQEQAKPAETPSNVYRPKAAGGTGFVARVANTEKQIDNESPWRRNNAGDDSNKNVESSSSGGGDKFNYTRSNRDEGNRDIRRDMPPSSSEQKSDGWRRPGGGDDRGGYGDRRNDRGGAGAGNNDRPSFGNRSERAEGGGGASRGGGMNNRFGGDSTANKADTSDSWRRRGDE